MKFVIKFTFSFNFTSANMKGARFHCNRNMDLQYTLRNSSHVENTACGTRELFPVVFLTIIWPGLHRGTFSHFMNYGETDTPAERCILNREICPLSLSWPGEDCEIMI